MPKPSTNSPLPHLPALDGLRGIAILLVVFWHYFTAFAVSIRFPAWVGVDLFFVLSGFLITGKLVESAGRKDYFSRFYRNRALRILPIYYAVLIAFMIFVHFILREKNWSTVELYRDHWPAFFVFTENWTFIFFGMPADLSLAPMWSLAVEEQFYLIWPLIIWLIPHARKRLRLFIVLAAIIMVIRSIIHLRQPGSIQPYFNTFLRIDSFMIGAILYHLHQAGKKIDNGIKKWVLLAALVIFVTCVAGLGNITPESPFFGTIGFTVTALLCAWLLQLALAPPNETISRFFNLAFLRFCGKISYGLYLIHLPVLITLGERFAGWGLRYWPAYTSLVRAGALLLSLLLSFLLSTISFRYFESPFLRLKKQGHEEREE